MISLLFDISWSMWVSNLEAVFSEPKFLPQSLGLLNNNYIIFCICNIKEVISFAINFIISICFLYVSAFCAKIYCDTCKTVEHLTKKNL